MKDTTGTVGLLKPLLMAGLLLHVSVCQSTAAAAANAHEVTVPVLRVGADYFTNAAVTAQSATRVTVIHSRGMLMAKMADLDPDVRRQLGFDPGPAKGSNGTATSAAGTNATVLGKLKTMGDGFLAGVAQAQADRETKGAPLFRALSEIGKRAEQEAKNSSDRFENPSWVQELVGFLILGLVFLLYVLFCKACGHLCRRAGSPPHPGLASRLQAIGLVSGYRNFVVVVFYRDSAGFRTAHCRYSVDRLLRTPVRHFPTEPLVGLVDDSPRHQLARLHALCHRY